LTRRFFLLALVGVPLLAFPLPALAWGPSGHEVIARLAQDHLSPNAKRSVKAILGPKKSLLTEANWADIVTRKPPKNKPWYKDYSHTKPWHYINLPVRESLLLSDFPRYCPKDRCVVRQVSLQLQVLRDPDLPDRQKRDALRFLIHLVGDIHMPLHCADDGDEGGNKTKVTFQGEKTNLHTLYDRLLYLKNPSDTRAIAKRLEEDWRPFERRSWANGTPEEWALESFLVARKKIYQDYWDRLRTAEKGVVPLPKDYANRMRPIVDQQLSKAAVRLAGLLNEVFEEVDRR